MTRPFRSSSHLSIIVLFRAHSPFIQNCPIEDRQLIRAADSRISGIHLLEMDLKWVY